MSNFGSSLAACVNLDAMLRRALAALLFFVSPAFAQSAFAPCVTRPDCYQCALTGYVDGDTFHAACVNSRTPLQEVTVRLFAVDAPETGERAKCAAEREKGRAASAYLAQVLSSSLEIIKVEVDQFGRWVAMVRKSRCDNRLNCQDTDIAAEMVWAGHAKPWPVRSAKPNWCD